MVVRTVKKAGKDIAAQAAMSGLTKEQRQVMRLRRKKPEEEAEEEQNFAQGMNLLGPGRNEIIVPERGPLPPGEMSGWSKEEEASANAGKLDWKGRITGNILLLFLYIAASYFTFTWNYTYLSLFFVLMTLRAVIPDEYDAMWSAHEKASKGSRGRQVPQQIYDTIYKDSLEKSSKLFIVRSIMKIYMIMLLAVQFTSIHAFAALIILFIGYFSMPTTYRDDEPWDKAEAYMRMLFGVMIAAYLWGVFAGRVDVLVQNTWFFDIPVIFTALFDWISGVPAGALFFIGLAFFCTLPAKEEPI